MQAVTAVELKIPLKRKINYAKTKHHPDPAASRAA
jgi:hypothetical protein